MTYLLLILLGLVCYLALGMAWVYMVEKYNPPADWTCLVFWPLTALISIGELAFYLATRGLREKREKALEAWADKHSPGIDPGPCPTGHTVEMRR